ncbi:MAG: purine-nucleoside phosphorylase [Acidobacteriota bacterium]|jgi:purine-nucleoside phosphorylase
METLTPGRLEEIAATFAAHHDIGRVIAALVAGSGITLAVPGWAEAAEVSYHAIFPFPHHPLAGHTPSLTLLRKDSLGLLVFNGRFHLYQGYSAAEVAAIPRLAGLLGAPVYVLTNAAGALDPSLRPGDLVVLEDHLNLQGVNALVGEWALWRQPRFPDMTDAYDPTLRGWALAAAREAGFTAQAGVYAGVLGPSFETPAEVRMLRALGGTVVGMSTVQEVIAARHMGMRVLGVSLVTNLAAGLSDTQLTHEEVMEVGTVARPRLAALLRHLVARLEEEINP